MPSRDRPVVFESSKITQFGFFLGSLVFVAVCLYFAIFAKDRIGAGSAAEFMMWVGAAFFSMTAALWLRQFLSLRGPVVIVTDTGLTDRRLAAEEIPWASITAIGEIKIRETAVVVLDVRPETRAGLTLTRVARFAAGPNRALGIEGLCVTTAGLNCDPDLLASLCRLHLARVHGAPVTLP